MTWDEVRVMIEKCEATSRAAGRPATGPNAAEATGTADMACMMDRKRGGALTDSVLPAVSALSLPRGTLPPPPSRKRTSGSR